MIEINIRIIDRKLPNGRYLCQLEAIPEGREPVTRQELFLRDMVMEALSTLGKSVHKLEGVESSYVAEVPIGTLKERRKNERGTGRPQRGPETDR